MTRDPSSVVTGSGSSAIFKQNGGQASALNTGFRASRGDVIFFVDSDDVLLPHAVERAVECFSEQGIVKAPWPLSEIDRNGVETGRLNPDTPLAEGNLRENVIEEGFAGDSWPPTSGNAWARWFLECVLPIPEKDFVTCPDAYLCTLAPLFGIVRAVPTPLAEWRIHGNNHGLQASFDAWMEEAVVIEQRCLRALEQYCALLGLETSPERWRRLSWRRRLQETTKDIAAVVPTGHKYVLVDQATWEIGELVPRRHKIPFLEHDGKYWGPPIDDVTAIQELGRLRGEGASFIVFAWPAFWWLDYYEDFTRYLRSHFPRVLENDRLIAFDMRPTLTELQPQSGHGSSV